MKKKTCSATRRFGSKRMSNLHAIGQKSRTPRVVIGELSRYCEKKKIEDILVVVSLDGGKELDFLASHMDMGTLCYLKVALDDFIQGQVYGCR